MSDRLMWRKSSSSMGGGDGNDCVELALLPDGSTALRDSKLGNASPVLTFSRSDLTALLNSAKAGKFDS
jgi:hypothetical protein